MRRPAETVELARPPAVEGGNEQSKICGACEPTLLWLSIAFQMFFRRTSEFQATANASRSYAFFARSA